ncbi:STAS domain-containing protein [Solirubrobacter ginsenosidimutans]|uniref:STAS domain-containing protein n=1 Tax=Solirubrobacter ginsenosidimutans TaxID=490573 RepID=A0A9X3N1A8_9ACTN|nr:STAS domain-containing protein [Solirubrobacter ginsenosidimutans]MDA0163118.1 STAS domain-containing protein [Solirubrobacter ginsenosidimutans]
MSDIASLFVWRRRRVVIAAITGEIDISNARELEAEIVAELDAGAAGLVIDLGGLGFLDGSGVHLLYRLADRLNERGLGFALVLPEDSPPYRVLALSGTRPRAWTHAREDDALSAVLR